MKTRMLLHFGFLILIFLAPGCASNSERAAKMSRSGPKSTHMSDLPYYAVCLDRTSGGHDGPWHGQERTSKEWAIRDAAQHEKDFPGHHPRIENKISNP
jgi:hypothetical protein